MVGMNALHHAICLAGSRAKFAQVMGVSSMTVYQWQRRKVPAEHCPSIERAFGVRCEDLRPDVDWSVLRCPEKGSLSSS